MDSLKIKYFYKIRRADGYDNIFNVSHIALWSELLQLLLFRFEYTCDHIFNIQSAYN